MARRARIVFHALRMLRLVSLLGVLVLVALCWLASKHRRAVRWRLVAVGLAMQFAIGGLFVAWGTGRDALYRFGEGVRDFLALSAAGTRFVFGPLADAAEGPSLGFVLATQALPVLIFFSSLMAVLYHLGVMQLVVHGMARVTARVLGTSGAESLSACGNVFVGQTEAPMMVRPFLGTMTVSELHAVMTGGFATIAGSVFALYVAFGIAPGHLMVASVMAVPAGLVCAKLLWPETATPETLGRVVGSGPRRATNVVEAAAQGAADGLRLALNVAAMLIAFLGLVAVLDWLLGKGGEIAGVDAWLLDDGERLSLDRVLGWAFAPIAAVMGVEAGEVTTLGRLLGTKLVLTELVAYRQLGEMQEQLSERTVRIASFALCGFANLASVAIQIGGLGALAPERRGEIASLAFRAMFGGAIATCMTACVAGVLAP